MDRVKKNHNKLIKIYKELFEESLETRNSITNLLYKTGITDSFDNHLYVLCNKISYLFIIKIVLIRVINRNLFSSVSPQKILKVIITSKPWELFNNKISDKLNYVFDCNNIYKKINLEIYNNKSNEKFKKFYDDLSFINEKLIEYFKLEDISLERNNFSDNVLGEVYEKMINKEGKKFLGKYYTSDFIVDIIIEDTIGRNDILSNPFARIIDLSCGSGNFLIRVYSYLKDKFLSNLYALRNKYAKEKYKVEINEKEFYIYGVIHLSFFTCYIYIF